jgi:hypothetical protein
MGKYGGHMGKYGGHMGKNGELIYDLGHMGISLELNSRKIMADIWELPVSKISKEKFVHKLLDDVIDIYYSNCTMQ